MQNKQSLPHKFHGLDHLRSLAILLVLFFHYSYFFEHPSWFPEIIGFGWTGVDLFFVLSGFLIASQLFSQIKNKGTISLREFYLKRVFRILPIYFVVIGIYFAFPFFRETEALPPLWKFLTFTQNFGIDVTHYGAFSHAWSLCVEEHFYILLPFILLFFIRFGFKYSYLLIIFLFLAGFAIRLYGWNLFTSTTPDDGAPLVNHFLEIIYYPTYNRLDGLLTGISIAAIYQFLPKVFDRISRYGNLLIFIGVILFTLVYLFVSTLMTFSFTTFTFPLISIAFGFMVVGAISPSCFLYRWKSKTSSLIAAMSYGLYLIHKGIFHMTQSAMGDFGIDMDGNIMLLLCIVFSLLVAYIFNLIIEKPFMRMRKKVI